MKELEKEFEKDTNVQIVYVQTTFEGHAFNTFEKGKEVIKKYGLTSPFGHAAYKEGKHQPELMAEYKTTGTPWITVISPSGHVMYNDTWGPGTTQKESAEILSLIVKYLNKQYKKNKKKKSRN